MRDFRLLADRERPLLWDLDGTIADTRRDIAAGVNGMLGDLGLAALSLDGVTLNVGKGARHLIARCLEVAGQSAPSEDDLETGIRLFSEHYGRHLLDTTQPYDGLADTLRHLFQDGRRMAVVSNKPEDFSRRVLDGLGLSHCFVTIVGGDSLSTRKPDPEPLLHALKMCHAKARPFEAIVIGDSPIDYEAAEAAGIPICAVAWGYDPEQRLQCLEPDWWIETPEELSRRLLGQP
jgi:phosphoglycolate phosphatase